MTDPFKIEEEEETKPIQCDWSVSPISLNITDTKSTDPSKPRLLADFQVAGKSVARICESESGLGIFAKGTSVVTHDASIPVDPSCFDKITKIHHSTLKKLNKTTINCRLKSENAAWLRQNSPVGPGGAPEIGSVLDGLVERARESEGAK